jgi:DNA-binding response OmpR family regulator
LKKYNKSIVDLQPKLTQFDDSQTEPDYLGFIGKSTILIVEDDEDLSEAYSILFKAEGYDVTSVGDAEQALRLIETKLPDLIVLDMLLPGKSGLDFLDEYAAKYLKSKTKIVVLSNIDSVIDSNKAYERGVSKYILKSWATPKSLAKIVKELIKP